MKRLTGILSVVLALFAFSAKADFTGGISIVTGKYETDGSETEKAVTGVTSQVTNNSQSETFVGASVFVEYFMDNGFALGVDYVPMDVDLGKGSRTDSSSGADVASEADTGSRTAEAHIDGLTTIYAHVPFGPMYGILGFHDATIKTKESLPTSSYGDVDLNGIQYGLGYKTDNVRFEVAYSDFDDIDITATGNTIANKVTGQNKISADADVLLAKISFAF